MNYYNVHETAEKIIDFILGCMLFPDFPVDLLCKSPVGYTEEQCQFALTLHLYGPKAYEFMRMKISLPHPRTLRKYAFCLYICHLQGAEGSHSLGLFTVFLTRH